MEGKPSMDKGDSEKRRDVGLDEVLEWLRDDIKWLRKHAKQDYLGKQFMQ